MLDRSAWRRSSRRRPWRAIELVADLGHIGVTELGRICPPGKQAAGPQRTQRVITAIGAHEATTWCRACARTVDHVAGAGDTLGRGGDRGIEPIGRHDTDAEVLAGREGGLVEGEVGDALAGAERWQVAPASPRARRRAVSASGRERASHRYQRARRPTPASAAAWRTSDSATSLFRRTNGPNVGI
jgi:hypothetical protein